MTKTLNLNRMYEWTDKRTNERRVTTSNRHKSLNNDMLMVMCEKFHRDWLASLTHFDQKGKPERDGRTNELTENLYTPHTSCVGE